MVYKVANIGKHTIDVKKGTKEITIILEGAFDEQATQAFVNDFKAEMGKINPSEYVITFDASNFNVLKQEMIPVLEGCFKLYKELNFKEIKMILGTPVLNMQVNRVARMAGLDNFSIVG
jgi:hypothetical protein